FDLDCSTYEPDQNVSAYVVYEIGAQFARLGGVRQVQSLFLRCLGGVPGRVDQFGGSCEFVPVIIIVAVRTGAVLIGFGQTTDDGLVTQPLAHRPDGVEHRVGPVHLRGGGLRVQLLDVLDVAAQHSLFQGLGAEHVVGHQQEVTV